MDGHEQYPVLLVPTWDPWNDFFSPVLHLG